MFENEKKFLRRFKVGDEIPKNGKFLGFERVQVKTGESWDPMGGVDLYETILYAIYEVIEDK